MDISASTMAMAGDGRALCDSSGAGEKFRKRSFRPEINEDHQNVSQEAGRNNSTGASEPSTHQGGSSASIAKSELEQILKQMTFTRSETQHFISLLHSRTIEESPTSHLRLEPSTRSGLLKRHKHGDERANIHASVVGSGVLEIASPAELAKAYKGSTSDTHLSKTSVASSQHRVTMENLPDELLINIFIRLLAKQLAQMRSVSKSWNALLSQSSFVKSHLHQSIHNNDQILLVFHEPTDSKLITVKPSRSPCLEFNNFIKLPVNPRPQYTNGISVIGSVNGLICSSYGSSVIHIWNPSLSAVLTLPPYSTPSHGYNLVENHFRFGFDPKTDDYKVVKITGLTEPPTYAVTWWLQIEIYSMRKGSWKLITERFPSRITNIIDGDYVCVDGHDGHLHWLGCIGEKTDSETIIVALDLCSETFSEIPLPDSVNDNHENILGVLAKKLCLMSQVRVGGAFEVWVMDEYGVAESWVKRHVFSQFSDNTCLFGFTSHDEFLIEDNGYLVYYNPSANEQKILEDHCPAGFGVHNIAEYVDSLVWVVPTEHEMVDDGGQN